MNASKLLLVITLLPTVSSLEALANPRVEPKPIRIARIRDLREAIANPASRNAMEVGLTLAMAWDGRRDLLLEAIHGKNQWLRGCAMRGLASLGEESDIAVLLNALRDTTLTFRDRLNAAEALGHSASSTALPALQEFTKEAATHGRVYEGVAKMAVAMVQRPDLREPLIVQGNHFLQFRFFVEDLRSIYLLRRPLSFVSSGMIYSEDSKESGSRHHFRADEFEKICSLLQTGTPYRPGMLSEGECLVFELTDGRHMAVTRSGSTFWALDFYSNRSTAPWFCVTSEKLSQYLDRAFSGDSPNGVERNQPRVSD